MTEPSLTYVTLRDAGEELHLECRMSDGQKGAFVRVDSEFPQLAERILQALTPSENATGAGERKWERRFGAYDIRGCWVCGVPVGEPCHAIGCNKPDKYETVKDDYLSALSRRPA